MGKKSYAAFSDDDAWRSLRNWVAANPEADPESLRGALAELGRPPAWRELGAALELLGMRAPGGAPPFLAEFVGRLAAAREAGSVLDAYATSPTTIAALAEFLPKARAVALTPHEWVERAGRSVAPAIDWRVGMPFETLGSLDSRFDLIAATPPLGARGKSFPIRRGLGEYANSLMVDLGGQVSRGGALVVLVSDGFFFRADAERTRTALAELGLRVEAAISVEGGLRPRSQISTSLLVITHGDPLDRLFVGRLDPTIDPGGLLENMSHRRPGEFLQLGYLYPAKLYRGWRALIKEHELLVGLGKSRMPFVSLKEIAVAYTQLPAKDDSENGNGNSVYVPEFPQAKVLIAPPEKPRGYTRVDLDPKRANARWVAKWLNEPLGRTARLAFATGSAIERIRRQDLGRLMIVLPPLDDQIKAIDIGQELQLIAGEVADTQSGLYTGQLLTAEAQGFLERIRKAFADDDDAVSAAPTVGDWIERLPFPLASIGRRYLAVQSPREKLDHLQHFFEAYGIFMATLLLSAARRDAETYQEARLKLRSGESGRSIFSRTSFYTWITLGSTLAKRMAGRLEDDKSGEVHATFFGSLATEFTDPLVAGDYFDVLDTARPVRNRRSHGGIEGEQWVEAQLARLQAALNELRLQTPHPFAQVHLLQPRGSEQEDDNLFTFGQARCLMGSHQIFSQRKVQSTAPMRARGLYLVPASGLAENPLQLLPLIHMLPVSGTDEYAAYYYNRHLAPSEPDKFLFVTYHFAGQPEEQLTNSELASLIADLTPE